MNNPPQVNRQRSFSAAIFAFLLWGFFPIYWKQLAHIPAMQVLAYRIAFCAVFMMLYLVMLGKTGELMLLLKSPRKLTMTAVAALLIGANWYIFILAVTTGHIMQASLGYYVNPLLNVVLGVTLLGERLSVWLKIAVALCAAGVSYLTWSLGSLPLYSIILALTFGFYGLVRKKNNGVSPTLGLAVESLIFAPVAILFLSLQAAQGQIYLGNQSLISDILLVGGGLATALPLLLFVTAAQNLDLSIVGILQFIAPTCQLFCAVVLYDEAFTMTHVICFSFIWAGLAVFLVDQLQKNRVAKINATS